ncbi:MAG TPA: hypothetical protein VJT71_05715 [Pyrinomonadaceae bacterium]|nr:hypothetical protein [Pyrinomonadaceae bacterium]
MYKPFLGLIFLLLLCPSLSAQTPELRNTAANSIQASPAATVAPAESTAMIREIKIPAGTSLDIEVMRTVSSLDARVGDFVSFRVLIPVKVDDAIVIGSGALVSGRLVKAKRAGHWGKAGKLGWTMQDVVAVDLTRVSLSANPDFPGGQQGVTGQSHGTEVATKTAVMGALLAPTVVLAPLALMHGFKRGEQAVLPEGKRFVVYVKKDTIVRIPIDVKVPRIDR